MVANLLNNAATYTSSGGRVELAVRREGAEAREFVVHLPLTAPT